MFVPQLLEKNQQNLEFPKYHIVNTPTTSSGYVWRTETKLPVCVCGGGEGDDTPCLYLIGYTHTI
jgi:hypothetical protein